MTKNEEMKGLLPKMEKIVQESEKILNIMREALDDMKKRYERTQLSVDKLLYEKQEESIKRMEAYVQSFNHRIAEYRNTIN